MSEKNTCHYKFCESPNCKLKTLQCDWDKREYHKKCYKNVESIHKLEKYTGIIVPKQNYISQKFL